MKLLISAFGLLCLAMAQNPEKDLFPVYAGGTGDEFINCFAMDEANGLILVGGNTTSSDFAPAANDHGFLYALDLEGNWMWSKFFYNVSYAI